MKKIDIKKDYSLASQTGFKLGGRAAYFVDIFDKDGFVELMDFVRQKNLPVFVLGNGTNLLIDDGDLKAVVVRVRNADLEFTDKDSYVLASAGAGVTWDDFVKKAVGRNLQGIECLSGIPGAVGGAPVQNIGAYGTELKETFVELMAFDLKTGKFKKFDKKDCEFGYRDSIFKKNGYKGRYIIWSVTLKLKKKYKIETKYDSLKSYLESIGLHNPSLQDIRRAVLHLRSQKLEDPKVNGNAGSFFKNPVVSTSFYKKLLESYPDVPSFDVGGGKVKLFAGWLIDKAGWRGKKYKHVAISPKNALVLTNPDRKGSTKEVLELSRKIRADIKDKFGVDLESEVEYVSF